METKEECTVELQQLADVSSYIARTKVDEMGISRAASVCVCDELKCQQNRHAYDWIVKWSSTSAHFSPHSGLRGGRGQTLIQITHIRIEFGFVRWQLLLNIQNEYVYYY